MKGNNQQQGAALILMFLALILLALSVFVVKFNPAQRNAEDDRRTFYAMHKAKQLLLSYAARPHGRESDSALEDRELQLARPGEMPCPDADNSGKSTFPDFDYLGANCRYKVGWFAWETFDSDDLFDSEVAELWFAVADEFTNKSGLAGYNESIINYTTAPSMTLDGRPVVAILLSSGAPFPHQLQRHVNDAAIAQNSFLEAENADGNNTGFVSQSTATEFNDIAIAISLDELLAPVEKQAAVAIAKRLNQYFLDNGQYPPPSSTGAQCDLPALPAQGDVPQDCLGVASTGPSLPFPLATATDAFDVWLVRNEWPPLFTYTRLASNRMRLSSRTTSSQMRPIEFESALQVGR